MTSLPVYLLAVGRKDALEDRFVLSKTTLEKYEMDSGSLDRLTRPRAISVKA
jgi:hypothetical protein